MALMTTRKPIAGPNPALCICDLEKSQLNKLTILNGAYKMSESIVRKFINKHYMPHMEQTVTIKQVWENRFRVNIWEEDPPKIKDSFFVRVKDGKVLDTDPPLVK